MSHLKAASGRTHTLTYAIPPSLPPSVLLLLWCSPYSLAIERSPFTFPGLDEDLGLAAIVDLHVDLGILVALVSEALEVAAVAQQVERQAESQHAQHQQAHIHLKTTYGSDRHHDTTNNQRSF